MDEWGGVEEIADRHAHHERIRDLLIRSKDVSSMRREVEAVSLELEQPEYPRWNSGVMPLDELYSGFQGLTVLGGDAGAGKSILALGSSLDAAHLGDCVLVFDAENGPGLIRKRIFRWYGDHDFTRFRQISRTHWWWHPVSYGQRIEHLMEAALKLYSSQHRGILVVFDSMNSIAEFVSTRSTEELEGVRYLLSWMDWLVRESDGFIRFIAVSELNADGGLKGRKAKFRATVGLAIDGAPDEGEDVVRMRLIKNRDGPTGDLGLFNRDWRTTRFYQRRAEGDEWPKRPVEDVKPKQKDMFG